MSALSEQNISQASYLENSLFGIKQLTMVFAAHEVLYWFRVTHLDITIQSNQSNCNSIKRSCAAGCKHRFYKCMYDWINSSHCCTIGTSARPNLAPTCFTTAVRTFALWWHSKGKYISHFIAETSIAETAAPNSPISKAICPHRSHFHEALLSKSKRWRLESFFNRFRKKARAFHIHCHLQVIYFWRV